MCLGTHGYFYKYLYSLSGLVEDVRLLFKSGANGFLWSKPYSWCVLALCKMLLSSYRAVLVHLYKNLCLAFMLNGPFYFILVFFVDPRNFYTYVEKN